jgi:hypothetical protein
VRQPQAGDAAELRTEFSNPSTNIVDHCCYAWNTLTDQPWEIMSIARRDWAAVGAKTIR